VTSRAASRWRISPGTDTAVILAGFIIHRLQAFVRVNPLSHVADATRDLMNNTGGGGPVAWSLIVPADDAARRHIFVIYIVKRYIMLFVELLRERLRHDLKGRS
jgi:hypothetical protein